MTPDEVPEKLEMDSWYYVDDWAVEVTPTRIDEKKEEVWFEEPSGSADSLSFTQIAVQFSKGGMTKVSRDDER